MTSYQIIISGRVQGVGFRHYIFQIALELNLFGIVRNLEDGQVEIIVQSTKEQLDQFIVKIRAGLRFYMSINSISISEIETKTIYKKFSVLYY